ncbi:hypothetical protein GCM10027592_17370 [Spirosoma flavus]
MSKKPYNKPEYWQSFAEPDKQSQWVAGLEEQFKQATQYPGIRQSGKETDLRCCLTSNSFWLLLPTGRAGQIAIRTCFDPQGLRSCKQKRKTKTSIEYELEGGLGTFHVAVTFPASNENLLRYTTSLTADQPFIVQSFPRDLYFLDSSFSSAKTEGMVYVTQSGPTSGLAFLSIVQPIQSSVFYLQNLTALSDYCQATQTEPAGTVAAQWPEAGFALPTSENPLPAGKDITLSDAFIYVVPSIPASEFEASDLFLDALAAIYPQLPKPDTTYFNWPALAERTVDALTSSPHCGRIINKQYYLNAYVDATQKPPESMVQLAILIPLWEYQKWLDKPLPLGESLLKNLPTFFDEKQETIMRWLPGGVFKEENRNEEQDPTKIDSWYLLHTLMNLGRLAAKGNREAKDLFFRSLEYVIRAAHEFSYNWPVFYNVKTLEVIKAETQEGEGGELDVAGLYTHVMVQAYELSQEPRYLQEAASSAERLRGKGFELLYQTNITIMSALTLAKLWKTTGNRLYFDLSRQSIANVVARFWIWDCRFGFGNERNTFMGVAPLKDAPYLAAYEEAEILATMLSYLKEVDRDVPDSVRLFFSEYIKYLLYRGRYYYPSELKPEMISQEPREGRIEPKLPIPLEDLPTGWQQAGTVGQEVYGGALAYTLTTYCYKRLANVPVIIFSDYPISQAEYQIVDKKQGYVIIRLGGTASQVCRVRVIAQSNDLPAVRIVDEDKADSRPLKPLESTHNYQEFEVSGAMRLRIEWVKQQK